MIANRYYRRTIGKSDPNAIEIYWATDAHVYAEVDGNPDATNAIGGRRFFYTSSQKLQNFVDDVNRKLPDLAFISGDMLEGWDDESVALFMSKWNQVDPRIRKELTIGNHDLAWNPELANTVMADTLGYGAREIIAGSKYNQSFYINKGITNVKIICFDTNIDGNGTHQVVTKQLFKKPVSDWAESEILNSTTNNIIMFSHASPADNEFHFNKDDQLSFKNMINRVKSQRPNLRLYSLAGHNHNLGTIEYFTLGGNVRCFTSYPVVDNMTGNYTIVKFTEESGLKFEVKPLSYPYP